VTLVPRIFAGSGASNSESMRTVPVKYSAGPFASARRRKSEPDWHKHARRVRYPEDLLQHAFYFFGVGEADAAAGEPASSTAKVQCVSTFLPPDFASTITLHLSRNFFVT
jgi:hypothetical protein